MERCVTVQLETIKTFKYFLEEIKATFSYQFIKKFIRGFFSEFLKNIIINAK